MNRSVLSFERLLRWQAGLVLLVIGAIALIAGLVQTTVSTFTGSSCPQGKVLIAEFTYDHGGYDFERPDGNANIVTITNGSGEGGSWSSSRAISHIIVEGGFTSVTTSFNPVQYSGTFSNAGLPTWLGRVVRIDRVKFCGPSTPPPTSTSTTTTLAPTTTTKATTSTTVAPTTTTTKATTTTTNPPTTTTVVSTGSTVPTTTTTAVPPTTTTTKAPTTTTVPGETPTSTTTAPTGSTTSPAVTTTTTPAGATTTTTSESQVGSSGATASTSTSIAKLANVDPGESLPRTGAPSVPLITLGSVLMAAGLAITVVSLRRQRGAH